MFAAEIFNQPVEGSPQLKSKQPAWIAVGNGLSPKWHE